MEKINHYAFMLRLKPGAAADYDRDHANVWPEMLALLKGAGISEYSIYRRDELLILTLRCADFNTTWSQIENDPVNLRWQKAMSAYFADMGPLRPNERFPMLKEVFYLP
jgi:L-rhamnose mutarotase